MFRWVKAHPGMPADTGLVGKWKCHQVQSCCPILAASDPALLAGTMCLCWLLPVLPGFWAGEPPCWKRIQQLWGAGPWVQLTGGCSGSPAALIAMACLQCSSRPSSAQFRGFKLAGRGWKEPALRMVLGCHPFPAVGPLFPKPRPKP